MSEGRLVAIYIAKRCGGPMIGLEVVEAVAGCGLRGDRYFNRRGCPPPASRTRRQPSSRPRRWSNYRTRSNSPSTSACLAATS